MADFGPSPMCKEHEEKHRPSGSPRTPCKKHLRFFSDLIEGFTVVRCLGDRKVLRELDRIADESDVVELAASAAARSEVERSTRKVKPRGDKAPRGWKLGHEILESKGLPADYLPMRREKAQFGDDAPAPIGRPLVLRLDDRLRMSEELRQAEIDAREKWLRSIPATDRAWRVAQLSSSDLKKLKLLRRRFEEREERLAKKARSARKDHAAFLRGETVRTEGGKRLKLPLEPTSFFGTSVMGQLHELLKPFTEEWRKNYRSKSEKAIRFPDNRKEREEFARRLEAEKAHDREMQLYGNPHRLIRLVLNAVAPFDHFSTTHSDIRTRLR